MTVWEGRGLGRGSYQVSNCGRGGFSIAHNIREREWELRGCG